MKFFTPGEATKTLPLVKKIVSDIINTGDDLRSLILRLGDKVDGNEEIEELKLQLSDYIDELTDLGCVYKDWNFEIGLVDFPAVINGRYVYLCWRSDESQLLYYHDLNEGYSGRKLIPLKYFQEE